MNNIIRESFGYLADGREVSVFTLKNASGMSVKISDLGGTVIELCVPDKEGRFSDVVCGFSTPEDYVNDSGYHGAIVGRVGNRISCGKFCLDGVEYSLCVNSGVNSIHGGREGFSHKLWSATAFDGDEPRIVLEYISPDMEEGYPGKLKVKVTYTLSRDNGLSVRFEAETDKKTIVNLTNHSYFNLGGVTGGSIERHMLWVDADRYNPTDAGLIPTGEIKSVEGTPFDFREEKPIGRDIEADDSDIKFGKGYDINLIFSGDESKEPKHRATLYDPVSGREMKIITNQPCVQVYTANHMKGKRCFKGGYPQMPRHAVALETQKMPDSVNHPHFTNVILDVGEKYDYITEYKFGIRK